MLIVVSYDVAQDKNGQRRLRKIAKICESFGRRVQYSVFEFIVDPAQWLLVRNKLESVYDPEFDSLRYYKLGSNYKNKIIHLGAKNIGDIQSDAFIL